MTAPRPPAVRDRLLAEQAMAYVATARRLGVSDHELLAAIRHAATTLDHETDEREAAGPAAPMIREVGPGT